MSSVIVTISNSSITVTGSISNSLTNKIFVLLETDFYLSIIQ